MSWNIYIIHVPVPAILNCMTPYFDRLTYPPDSSRWCKEVSRRSRRPDTSRWSGKQRGATRGIHDILPKIFKISHQTMLVKFTSCVVIIIIIIIMIIIIIIITMKIFGCTHFSSWLDIYFCQSLLLNFPASRLRDGTTQEPEEKTEWRCSLQVVVPIWSHWQLQLVMRKESW